MKKVLLLTVLLFLASCEDLFREKESLGDNAEIIGTWVQAGFEEDVTLFDRSAFLDSVKYGFIIRENGTFVERKNAGWYENSPAGYANFEGTWEALSDSLLEITVGYWGGSMSYQMRIVFLNQVRLGIRYLYADNRTDSR